MKDQHFLAISATTWATTSDKRNLRELFRLMEADKISWGLWLIPLPHDADYEINMYIPKVEGAQFLEMFNFMNGRKV